MNSDQLKAIVAIPIIIVVGFGFALAGSEGGIAHNGIHPFAASVLLTFAIQWIAFIPAYLMRTEVFFDLIGSLTYVLATVLALVLSSRIDVRSIILGTMVLVWSIRLGSFLFLRIHKAGKDGRFDTIKKCFARFLGAWTLQGLWVTFTLAAALAAITSSKQEPIGALAIIGFIIWLSGFLIEVVSDHQKNVFKANPENRGRFIRTGLWAHSRHPNYLGEILLWTGVAIVAIPVLQGWQWMTLSSPILITVLLTRVSGIPLLEKRSDEKWGGAKDYERYKENTPVLVPRFW